ncbi:MAG: hypothetical protein AMQ22_02161 [Candidatus Methanofastidiosum methylothiophilum]|uniref:Uncharacterized protein n=1 Tax=Candidatus Methanofastidiosum methylothiophilum TaxID=1705564 RepID=A0A150IMN9_9EURY|nr:MAG: hypothetical protein AMQ22_02161 [Candidatus Methanofastidiosum methylthiophilus]
MNFLFDEDKKKGSYEVETLKDSIRRIKNNLDIIYREIEEIERRVFNETDLFEIRENNHDDFVKNAINRKRPTRMDKEVSSFEADDGPRSFGANDFAKKLEEYDG